MASETSGRSAAGSSSQASYSDAELEKLLNREASAFQRELEVERILKAFKLNPYDILDVDEKIPAEGVKKKYKQLSLFIHPDKTSHPRAPEAFDLLKKAESDLSDKDKREILDALIRQARTALLKDMQLPAYIEDDDARLASLQPNFKTQLRAKSKELLIDEEVSRRKAIKMNLANEGLEAKRKEEETIQKKRKAEDDKTWEEGREDRVGSWRSFASAPKKKKKSQSNILG